MQAMKLFMGALAMANALEVDTESGPNKIQVAAQPNNAGVVSKTIKLATAAGVSAMAVDAINKLGTFETSPSGGDDPCQEPKGNKCVLCKPGFFLTVAGDCKKECPTGESPFWCPYQYCLKTGPAGTPDTSGTAAAACGTKKVTEATEIDVFDNQCVARAAIAAPNAGNSATCTYCTWSDVSGNNFYDTVNCILSQPAPAKYDLDRVAAELGSFTFYYGNDKCPSPSDAAEKNCINDIALTQQGWSSLNQDTASAIHNLIVETKGNPKFKKFFYGGAVGPIDSKVGEKLTPAFKKLVADANNEGIFVGENQSPLVTSVKNLVTKGTGITATSVEFKKTGITKLPEWVCEVTFRAGGGGSLDFTGTPACGTAQIGGSALRAAIASKINSCSANGGGAGKAACCVWPEAEVAGACADNAINPLFE